MAIPQLGDPPPLVGEGDVQQPEATDPAAVAEEWRSWMQEPGNRSAIMQFGINLMQPMAYGQTAAGHFGQALGGAGEAVDRFQTAEYREREQSRKEAETGSKIDEREGKLQLGEQGLAIKTMREETRKAESAAKIKGLDDRAKLWAEQATYWAARAQAEPGNAEAKRRALEAKTKLDEASTALKDEMTRATPLEVEIKRQAEERRTRQGDERTAQGAERIRQRDEEIGLKREALKTLKPGDLLKAWQAEQTNIGFGLSKEPRSSFEEWKQKHNLGGGAATPGASSAPAAPSGAGGSPVDTILPSKQGTFKKIKPGPDSDQSTWQKVK